MHWTNEQLMAINECGKNIIVSAGAGSGKTAVLTQRVISNLKKNINIQEMLILTFTNAAAAEMKDRIRSKISEDETLKNNLDYIDSAYITTFDSFSMSIVKKYHYLLNVSKNINILDNSVAKTIKRDILDEIFEKKYEENNTLFNNLIDKFTIKDDDNVKKYILKLNDKLDKLSNKDFYLDNYIDLYYTKENIDSLVKKYSNYLLAKKKEINKILTEVYNNADEKYYNQIYMVVSPLIKSKSYDELKINSKIKLPNLPRGSSEELKKSKGKLSEKIKNLSEELIYKDYNEIIETLTSTKDFCTIIIEIIKELDKKVLNYKNKSDVYEFNDIAKMAIDVVSSNSFVKEELKSSFKEIMVDEYQDTSDLQEEFINLIERNNVYMVGDVKQSIYRFRNANPDIFKDKYDSYSKGIGGIKIDLLNNFRSRSEVLDDINLIFSDVMDNNIGGADYKVSHKMVFGNNDYVINKANQNYNLEIYNYKRENKKYSNSEYEAFIIAEDIIKKINDGYMVLDKKTKKLRRCTYSDFCILIDRKSKYDTYKKIFEYKMIPLMIYYDEKITEEKDLLIIKNIIDLIIRIYNKDFAAKFKYDMYSVCRSYIGNISDQEYLDMINNNNFFENDIFNKCKNIADKLDSLSNSDLIDLVVKTFDFYTNISKVGDARGFIVRIDYLKQMGKNLSSLGYSVIDFSNYLERLIDNKEDITLSSSFSNADNVKLMNIHKSKGLEFSICYFAGYSSKFNRDDLSEMITYDNLYGIILPFYKDGLGNTITKKLFEEKYKLEDVSERIRLFYVALTRAKEKMIIVCDLNEEKDISLYNKQDYLSFLDIIYSIKDNIYNKIVNINDIQLTKKYNVNREINRFNSKSNEYITMVVDNNIENNVIEKQHASKELKTLITKEDKKKLEYGIYMHKIFETTDFNNSNNFNVNKLLSKVDITNSNIYKEYEFITNVDNKEYHGIIDLIIEKEDEVLIIDYKLKNIQDVGYKEQLKIYKNYIKNKLNKNVKTYLYSIVNDTLDEINV